MRVPIPKRKFTSASGSSYFYLLVTLKFLCRPEYIKSIFERVNCRSSNNIFRQTIPYICDSIAKRIFSEITMAATNSLWYDKIGMLGVTIRLSYNQPIFYMFLPYRYVCEILKLGIWEFPRQNTYTVYASITEIVVTCIVYFTSRLWRKGCTWRTWLTLEKLPKNEQV